jgi:uncharacterized membrane protein SpoIIM required for sporulation
MIESFVAQRRVQWERLSELLERAHSARRPLSVDEYDELARLCRQATSHLAIARRDFPNDRATLFVNQLVARAHSIIYRERPTPVARIRRFFAYGLPREYRSAWPYVTVSALLFFGPAAAAFLAIVIAPDVAGLMLPALLLDQIKDGRTWFDIDQAKRSAAASLIMTNNIRVSFLALSGGMLGGLGTVAALVYNGIHLGAVSGALSVHGLADRLVGFVSPHGFLELSVIVIAGACGLMLGRALSCHGSLSPSPDAIPGFRTTTGSKALVGCR